MTTKKTSAALFVAVFSALCLVASAPSANAASEAAEAKRMELKAEIQARKQVLEAKKAEAKAEAAAKKARTQLEALVDRLDGIKEKIERRIDKVEEVGTDVTPARLSLETASTTLAEARDFVKNATSTKRAFETAESWVKKSQKTLEDVVEVIKSLN